MKVLITGGSGLVGRKLTAMLKQKGTDVVWLSRKAGIVNGIQSFAWDYQTNTIDTAAFDGITHIVHLAGAGVFDKRWTKEYKKEIEDSRIETLHLLRANIGYAKDLKALISASAIGIYGNGLLSGKITESSPVANDFLADVTRRWEEAADLFEERNIRVAKIRVGIVLSEEGGALPAMVAPVKAGIGSPLASGRQYIPWIHVEDVCGIFIKAIEDESITGNYNAVAPEPAENKILIRTIAAILKKPFFMPNVPVFALQLVLGKERSRSVIGGAKISVQKMAGKGYVFKFPKLEPALKDLLQK